MATVSEEKSKPGYDEQTLDKLLEAAFVLQEHNRQSRKLAQQLEKSRDRIETETRAADTKAETRVAPIVPKTPGNGDYTVTLGRIVETQRQIQVRQLELLNAMSLVAERVVEVGSGSGAAIAVVDGQFVHYRAVSGSSAPSLDSTVPIDKALCSSCVDAGQVLRCDNVSLETKLDQEECARRSIGSVIIAPIFHQGNVTGALELYYPEAKAFTDQDVHTCQLMAGLVTEALVRDEEVTWKKSLASERAAMLEALEKLQPNLAALAEKSNRGETTTPANGSSTVKHCRRCGHELLVGEQFCGECGSPQNEPVKVANESAVASDLAGSRQEKTQEHDPTSPAIDTIGTVAPSDLESTAAQSLHPDASSNGSSLHSSSFQDSAEEETLDFAAMLQAVEEESKTEVREQSTEVPEESTSASEASSTPEEDDREPETTAIQKLTRPADWSSAAAAKDFLEQLAAKSGSGSLAQFWSARRGDIYLAISVVLVICVILWGTMSKNSVGASGAQSPATAVHAKAPDANLSAWDRMLIRMGLAEAPAPPEDKGNPATQVWIDERTALYYCPGTDLYGKTPKGKFASQRDAQLDQFEPAYRKPCN